MTPGQGQTVRVAGVRIGDIADVELKDGRAIVTMDIDPQYKDLVHTDATALLRPKTGLKDMFVELDPGSNARAGGQARASRSRSRNTLPDINPDEVLSALDADTRDYLQLLVNGAGQGLKGRGDRPARGLRALRADPPRPRRASPAQVADAPREPAPARSTRCSASTPSWPATATTSRSSSTPRRPCSAPSPPRTPTSARAVRELPARAAPDDRHAAARSQRFAEVLGPTADNAAPGGRARSTAPTTRVQPVRQARPRRSLRNEIRPFVREARPLVRDLKPGREPAWRRRRRT